ncbi:carbohydrate esterase family 3 protein [Piedraia hortae CBS 480.64]|uniref:Carbohydrate esterase family 3 protein n=1 Tax=Piedraia hortae CBS 480.64 TaxID=1314780 RepID=A0A6A7BWQ6_9PEZI|nr:carbohydrate esterase family 3 protein [Piedraia hortae CBS 480.64]
MLAPLAAMLFLATLVASAQTSIANGAHLTILPLGASIVWGYESSDNNGFRLKLRELLENNGNQVTYIGSQHNGGMTNNACEAYPGKTIEEVTASPLGTGVFDDNPNVVLIHLGTNNCVQNKATSDSANHYGDLLNDIKKHAPNAVVVASTLIPNGNANIESCIKDLNNRLSNVVANARSNGQKITLVDMHAVVPLSQLNADKTHPTDTGYQMMAQSWYSTLLGTSNMLEKKARHWVA